MKKLLDIVKKLRSPEGCPWDQKQTHQSLIPFLLEETWEVIDEIDKERLDDSLKGELGDLLLQIALHACIAEEENRFRFEDVVEAISEKMVRRHPHVFNPGNNQLSDDQLSQQWRRIKREEKTETKRGNIPESAPALLSALKISKRAAGLGFDWESPWDVLSKIEEELEEVRQEMKSGDSKQLEQELGDLLFTVVNLARKYNINPEIALRKGNIKFTKRFNPVEESIIKAKENGADLSLNDMEKLWNKSKANET